MITRDNLLAELASVRRMISMIPADQVIDRASLEGRIRRIQEQLDTIGDEAERPTVSVYFDGGPVVGSQGIEAGFATEAVKQFSNAVTACARHIRGELSPEGPLGRRELFITHNKLAGSFGFELQAIRPDLDPNAADVLRKAIESVGGVIEGSLKGDEELADAADAIQPRVLALVRSFFTKCIKREAVFRMTTASRTVAPSGITAITLAAQRLKDTETEKVVQLQGHFIGVTTDQPTFEFQEGDGDRLVRRGKISPELGKEELRSLADSMFKPCIANFRVTRVGQSPRGVRYVLIGFRGSASE